MVVSDVVNSAQDCIMPPQNELEPRERLVMNLAALGMTDLLVAHVLDISVLTVQAHIARILPKLGASTRAEAVATWLRRNPPPSGLG